MRLYNSELKQTSSTIAMHTDTQSRFKKNQNGSEQLKPLDTLPGCREN